MEVVHIWYHKLKFFLGSRGKKKSGRREGNL